MLVFGALLTAFYMTRQVSYVFFGKWRGHGHAHESPRVMTMPLAILAFFAIALGAIWDAGVAVVPRLPREPRGGVRAGGLQRAGTVGADADLVLVVVAVATGLGWWLYGNKSPRAEEPDALEKAMPPVWAVPAHRFYVDELYGVTVIAFYAWWARVADWLDRRIWGGAGCRS